MADQRRDGRPYASRPRKEPTASYVSRRQGRIKTATKAPPAKKRPAKKRPAQKVRLANPFGSSCRGGVSKTAAAKKRTVSGAVKRTSSAAGLGPLAAASGGAGNKRKRRAITLDQYWQGTTTKTPGGQGGRGGQGSNKAKKAINGASGGGSRRSGKSGKTTQKKYLGKTIECGPFDKPLGPRPRYGGIADQCCIDPTRGGYGVPYALLKGALTRQRLEDALTIVPTRSEDPDTDARRLWVEDGDFFWVPVPFGEMYFGPVPPEADQRTLGVPMEAEVAEFGADSAGPEESETTSPETQGNAETTSPETERSSETGLYSTLGSPLPPYTFVGRLTDGAGGGPNQEAVVSHAVATLRDPTKTNAVFLELPCGWGKTLAALAIAWKMGGAWLFLVHTSDLMNQAIARIREFFPAARVGRLWQSKVEVEDRHFVVGMIQSVMGGRYDALGVFGRFRGTIVDEAHHMSAPCFSTVRFRMVGKYRVGISATPDQQGDLQEAIHLVMGPVIYRDVRVWKNVTVRLRSTEVFGLKEKFDKRAAKRIKQGRAKNRKWTTADFSAMVAHVAGDRRRNEEVAFDIAQVLSFSGRSPGVMPRRCLCLVSYDNPPKWRPQDPGHVQAMHDGILAVWLSDYCESADEAVQACLVTVDRHPHAPYGRTRVWPATLDESMRTDDDEDYVLFSIGALTGKTKEADRLDVLNKTDCVVATYKMMSEGVDPKPPFDTVAHVVPKKDNRQPNGRAYRPWPNKNTPLILHYTIDYDYMAGLAAKHYREYAAEPSYDVQRQKLLTDVLCHNENWKRHARHSPFARPSSSS